MPPLELGFSPCPNDTFIFHALIHGIVAAEGLSFRERLLDVEQLNQLALAAALDVTKVSFHLYGHIRKDYHLLSAGAALGRGCGPLLVSRGGTGGKSLAESVVALPGRYTTAALLLRLYAPEVTSIVYLPFDRIMPAVASGEVDAGVIIHESRFTFTEYGLVKLADLGEWWEQETGCPIPLGGIVARKSLGGDVIQKIETALRQSIEHAFACPADSLAYIREHSQEMSATVCEAHIKLYVNQFSLDLGEEGRRAVAVLMERGEAAGLLPG
ncbi:MAG: 1,4-dihydroxy-6-naphthoate synthase [Geobacter sp.]|nr:1,4-dihydroxy-6-naphthoate synthase [Geobacter sp.]